MKADKKTIICLLGGAALLAGACSRDAAAPAPSSPRHIAPVYATVASYSGLDDAAREEAYAADSVALTAYARYMSGSDGIDPREALLYLSESQPVEVFTPAVDSIYPTLEPVEEALGAILAQADAAGLRLPRRSYAAVVHGRNRSMVFVDSVMLIALNHYLGADYPGYSHWPGYRRAVKTPAMLPYDMAEALVATQYPPDEEAATTVLSRMLYQGVLSLMRQKLGGGDEAASLGYDAAELAWLDSHEGELWQALVGRGLLYDTSALTADRLLAPSPATTLLSPEAPGRAGRYIGRRIVDAYLVRHPEASASFLLSPVFYASPKVLAEAGYAPASR